MSYANENTALIGDGLQSNRIHIYHDEDVNSLDQDDSLWDRPVGSLMARYGSPMVQGSLGLSGGMGVFGTSLTTRHSSIFNHMGTGSSTVRRPSRATFRDVSPFSKPTERLSRSASHASTIKSIASVASDTQVHSDESNHTNGPDADDDYAEHEIKEPKYLGGVTDAQFWACFTGIMLTYFVACFDSTLMASSHPVITSYFDASNAASWLSTSFLLTSTAFQPMFGRVSDTFGRRGPFLFSLASFALGTLWCALAQSIMQFILARAVCGLGAGGALAMGAIIISDLVPLERRSGYLALLNLSYGVGSSLGAALGGLLAETLGWRWEFGIQVPAVFLCVVVAMLTTPSDLGPMLYKETPKSLLQTLLGFDLAGSALLTSSVTCLILFLNLGGNILPWTHPFIIASFFLCLVLGTALIRVERRAAKPVMPLHMLFDAPRGNLIFSNFFNCMTLNTILFNAPLYFQAVMLDSATRSGTRLIAPFLCNMVAAFATGNFIAYTLRVRPTLILGAVLIVAGSIALTFMSRDLPSWAYSVLIALGTGGQGFNFPTISIAILAVSHTDDMAVATSTLILFRSLGTVMGVAVSSLVAQNALTYYLEQFVTGVGREEVIREVRRSVDVVVGLDPVIREQVIEAYASAMKMTFAQGIVTAIVGLLLLVWIKLPRLSNQPIDVAMAE